MLLLPPPDRAPVRAPLFDGFGGPPSLQKRFVETVKRLTDMWCCAAPAGGEGAGHVWYDLLVGQEAHVDRFGRLFNRSSWAPVLGP